jgi:hypothetical protein
MGPASRHSAGECLSARPSSISPRLRTAKSRRPIALAASGRPRSYVVCAIAFTAAIASSAEPTSSFDCRVVDQPSLSSRSLASSSRSWRTAAGVAQPRLLRTPSASAGGGTASQSPTHSRPDGLSLLRPLH